MQVLLSHQSPLQALSEAGGMQRVLHLPSKFCNSAHVLAEGTYRTSGTRLVVHQHMPQQAQRGLAVAIHERLGPDQALIAQRRHVSRAAQRAQRARHIVQRQRAPLGREVPRLHQAPLACMQARSSPS